VRYIYLSVCLVTKHHDNNHLVSVSVAPGFPKLDSRLSRPPQASLMICYRAEESKLDRIPSTPFREWLSFGDWLIVCNGVRALTLE
jgi:hypothetical protein